MKIGIISNKEGSYGNLLTDAAKKRGHEAQIFPIGLISVLLEDNLTRIECEGIDLLEMDVILVRGMNRSSCLRVLIDLLDREGVRIVDKRLVSTYDNNNKFYAYRKLQSAGIAFPKTYYVGEPIKIHLDTILAELGEELPVIAKIGSSSQGRGVFLIDSAQKFEEIVNSLNAKDRHQLFFQEHLAHTGDIRAFVIGGKVIGAMFRKRSEDEYRSNIALGAKGSAINLKKDLEELAVNAADVLEMEIAGVDILESNSKAYVIEVNRSPQFKGLMTATGIDMPDEIIKYCESLIK